MTLLARCLHRTAAGHRNKAERSRIDFEQLIIGMGLAISRREKEVEVAYLSHYNAADPINVAEIVLTGPVRALPSEGASKICEPFWYCICARKHSVSYSAAMMPKNSVSLSEEPVAW